MFTIQSVVEWVMWGGRGGGFNGDMIGCVFLVTFCGGLGFVIDFFIDVRSGEEFFGGVAGGFGGERFMLRVVFPGELVLHWICRFR